MSDDRIDELQDVLVRLLDSVDGYENAIEQADSTRFQSWFRDRVQQRRQYATDLRAAIESMGGEADDDGSLLAGAHRLFTNIKASIKDGDEAVLEEIERGEQKLIEEYRDALKDVPATDPAHALLSNQLTTVESDLVLVRRAENAID